MFNQRKENLMRKFLVGIAVASLAACSSTPPAPQAAVQPVQQAPGASMSSVPDWFTEVPKSDDYIYAVGDGVSGSVSGSLGNARANAFEGICQGAGGTVRSQTKIFRQDTESSSSSMSTTAIRNFCADVNVAGATVEKSKIVVENGRYHAFVLVALPLGDKNKVTKAQREQARDNAVKSTAEREFRELDQLNDKSKAVPVSDAGGITLMNVDNAEYKAKRDAALQKEGAVIGQSTVR
jgi:hypothetical protein